jgi:uncharacterized protein (DUF1330 family)
MPAYVISRIRVKDPDLMKRYADQSIPLAKSYGAKYVVRSNNVEALDGSYDGRRLVIIEFPDTKSARAFWDSPQYQELRKLRLAATDSDIWLVPED